MKSITFLELAKRVLEQEKTPLTAYEIWQKAKKLGLAKKVASKGKTPWQTIGAQLYIDLRDNKKTPFEKCGTRPTRFYLKGKCPKTIKEEPKKIKERDVHPWLASFLYANPHFKARSRTIYHEVSSKKKKGANKWLHPDVVAVHFPFNEYTKEILELQDKLSSKQLKIFSFELKFSIDFSNIREAYFQAVSNSSWANEGYLVAVTIEEDEEFKDELRRLNEAFGIGIIQLDIKNIYESKILFPAKERTLDWTTMNKLAENNVQFRKFLADIKDSLKINKEVGDYDKLLPL